MWRSRALRGVGLEREREQEQLGRKEGGTSKTRGAGTEKGSHLSCCVADAAGSTAGTLPCVCFVRSSLLFLLEVCAFRGCIIQVLGGEL